VPGLLVHDQPVVDRFHALDRVRDLAGECDLLRVGAGAAQDDSDLEGVHADIGALDVLFREQGSLYTRCDCGVAGDLKRGVGGFFRVEFEFARRVARCRTGILGRLFCIGAQGTFVGALAGGKRKARAEGEPQNERGAIEHGRRS